MRYIQTLLSDTLSDTNIEIVLVGEQRNRVKSALYLQVEEASNDFVLEVYGKMSQMSDNIKLASVDMSAFEKKVNIDEDGIFWILSEELYSVTLDVQESARIILKSIE